MFFKKKNREPLPSPAWTAREAEIQRRISTLPELRMGADEVLWPHGEIIKTAWQARDYDTLERVYTGLAGYDRTQFVGDLEIIADDTISQDDVDAAVARNTPFSYIIAIIVATQLGWDHRGTGTLNTVSESGLDYFHQYNMDAMQYAIKAHELDPSDANALALAQSNARIMSRDACFEWAEQWQNVEPWNHLGWLNLAEVVDRRWGGNDGDLIMIANHLAENAPEGSYTLAAACEIMNREWLTLFQFYDVPSEEATAQVWLNPNSARIVDTIYQRFVPHTHLTGAAEIRAWGWLTQALYQTRNHHGAVEGWNHMNGTQLMSAWIRYREPMEFAATARANSFRVVTKYENPLPEDLNDGREMWDPRLGAPQARI